MFKIGDRVVCASNKINSGKHKGIYVGHIYTIVNTYDSYSDELYIMLYGFESNNVYEQYFSSKYFMTISDYRKKKLKKINNTILK